MGFTVKNIKDLKSNGAFSVTVEYDDGTTCTKNFNAKKAENDEYLNSFIREESKKNNKPDFSKLAKNKGKHFGQE